MNVPHAATTPDPVFGPPDDAREADLAATWFARIGALALLVGAGFGYKFAVDRGLIGPGARVALGVVTAVALILGGEWAARRGWSAFAQAVAGGGGGLLYLTTWAAFHQYGLIDAPVAFGLLAVAATVGAGLALRHDSQALGILATLGAFANPVVAGSGAVGTGALFGYVVTVDLCVLALAYARGWEVLTWVAAAGSWTLFLGHAFDTGAAKAIVFATTYQVIFGATAVFNTVRARDEAKASRAAGFVALNGAVYVASLMAVMTPGLAEWRGAALALNGVAYLSLAYGLWKKDVRGVFVHTVVSIGVALAVVCVPVHFGPASSVALPFLLRFRWIAALWAAEGAAAVFAGYRFRFDHGRLAGAVLMIVSAGVSVMVLVDGGGYRPGSLIVSASSLTYVLQASALFAGAFALMKFGSKDERQAGRLFLILGHALTLVWMGLEASAYLNRTMPISSRLQALQFTLTAMWAVYAGALVAVGVARRSRLSRWLGVGLFGATILKLVLSDVWLLSTGYRTLVFVGVGALLLACSLLYSRFKDVVLRTAA